MSQLADFDGNPAIPRTGVVVGVKSEQGRVSAADVTTNGESPSAAEPNTAIGLPRERGQTDRRTHSEAAWELQPGRGHSSLLAATPWGMGVGLSQGGKR